jgi:hypothetical protein
MIFSCDGHVGGPPDMYLDYSDFIAPTCDEAVV